MEKEKNAVINEAGSLAEVARSLMAATADVTGEKVTAARKRLARALENSKELYGRAREKAIDAAKVTDRAVRDHPYQALGLALGIGACVGYLIARQTRNQD